MRLSLSALQPLGRALMLPIAVLPVAGLLLRLGQHDLLNIPFVAAAGDAVFQNLGLLFAIGVAVGFARDGNGAAGLAGVVCYLVATHGAENLVPAPKGVDDPAIAAITRLGVPLGILSGLIAGGAYNRFGTIKLPEYLAFFGGRRFVPIVSGFCGLILALVFGLGWRGLNTGIDGLSRAVVAAGPLGLFAYGVLNRLLIVTGLHHILNNLAWFILGDFHGATGDLNRFFAGDPTAGAFMSGFFPVMMFGLPAACLAMYHTARPERRAVVGGMLASLALTAMLTGVTEPIEFSFMFLAPGLYVLHAFLTGASMTLMDALHVRLGFSFSAGLFDYVINFGKATRPLMLLPVGAVYFVVYYAAFRFAIQRFDLKSPGRETDDTSAIPRGGAGASTRAEGFIAALGGGGNLVSVDACTTRLRLVVADRRIVDPGQLKALGAHGVIHPTDRDVQVVLGPIADQIAREMREIWRQPARLETPAPVDPRGSPVHEVPSETAQAFAAALGGPANIETAGGSANRVLVTLVNSDRLDLVALARLGVRGVARPTPHKVQLVLERSAIELGGALKDSALG